MNRKQAGIGLLAFLGMLVLILDAPTALSGAQEGVKLCIRTVIPSLFPFFILSILLNSALSGNSVSVLAPVGYVFGIPRGMESILISAFLGGYPVGAQAVADAYRKRFLKKEEAQRLLGFCNNPGPAFLFGMVSSAFPNRKTVWAVWMTVITSAWLVSRISSGIVASPSPSGRSCLAFRSVMGDSVKVMAMVCGWVVFFRVVISFLNRWILWIVPLPVQVAVAGLLELTNGCVLLTQIPDIRFRFILCCVLLSFGGLCVTLQTMSVLSGLSIGHYLRDKLIQTLFSLLLSVFLVYRSIPCLLLIGFFFLPRAIKKQKKSRIIRKAIV